MTESQVDTGAATTRRAMLGGAGAVGATALLAACGTSHDDGSVANGNSGADTGGTAGTSAPTTGAPNAGGGAGGGTKLGESSAIPVDGGKVFAEQQIVVTQPAKGEFKGFTAVCTHAGCTVANVKNGVINCGCHGSQFSIEDGSVKKGPAQQPLDQVKIKVSDGSVWLNG
jgi:Rieske Fe-S protein